jgi:glutathione synthase
VKPLDGMGGTSVFRVREGDPNRNVIVETVSQHGGRMVMVQRYLPEIVDGDKRVLLIAGEVVPFCLARIPKEGESRGNLRRAGEARRARSRRATARSRSAWRPGFGRRGLMEVGLDVIGPCLTEVNVPVPTCFVEITQQTGFDLPGMFADALARVVRENNGPALIMLP